MRPSPRRRVARGNKIRYSLYRPPPVSKVSLCFNLPAGFSVEAMMELALVTTAVVLTVGLAAYLVHLWSGLERR
jgi:hypothetical protein